MVEITTHKTEDDIHFEMRIKGAQIKLNRSELIELTATTNRFIVDELGESWENIKLTVSNKKQRLNSSHQYICDECNYLNSPNTFAIQNVIKGNHYVSSCKNCGCRSKLHF